MMPLVTVVTPSYNQGRFIRKTIESVLAQDYENIEYLVIDGGSTDETLDILKEYDGRLTYISEKDQGQSDAINKGFKMAKGEIVAWLNSDDVYEPGCIKSAVEEFGKDENIGLVYADGYIIDEGGNKLKIFEYTQEFDFWKLVNFWDYIMQPATFFRANYLEQVGYLDIGLHYCMDWDLWIKLASVSEVKYVHELWACSREYEETKTSTGGEERLEEITKLLQKYSKKKRPLGVLSYRASTYYNKYAKGFLSRLFMEKYLVYIHQKLSKQMPVLYQDGWIGKEYSMIIPNTKRRCRILFEAIRNEGLPNKLCVFADHKLVCEKYIKEPGEFQIEFEINNYEEERVELNFRCSRTFKVPKDSRELSLRIKQMAII